jgi:TolA-binding protein
MTDRPAWLAAAALALLVLLISPVARAQVESREGIALQNQILELRRQVQNLQDQGAGGRGTPTYLGRSGYPPPSSGPGGSSDLVAQLLSRVDALEEQVRQLRGQIDQTQNQVQRQGADLSKRIDDMAFQTQNPQGGMPPGTAPMQPPPPTPMSPAQGNLALLPPPSPPGTPPSSAPPGQPPVPVRRTPELALQEGNAALARRDYPAAEQAAREVLGSSRTSPRAYDAQFVLAEALMGQRQYSQAAIAYDDTYNRSRKGAHAPDALLGLANALTAINEKRAACDTLTKLRAEYPSVRPDIRDAATASAQRAGCR